MDGAPVSVEEVRVAPEEVAVDVGMEASIDDDLAVASAD